jgi:hypothetical protein
MYAYKKTLIGQKCTCTKKKLTGDFTGGLVHDTVEHNEKIYLIKGKQKEEY